MKPWPRLAVVDLLVVATAAAFAVPLFLALRERKLAAVPRAPTPIDAG